MNAAILNGHSNRIPFFLGTIIALTLIPFSIQSAFGATVDTFEFSQVNWFDGPGANPGWGDLSFNISPDFEMEWLNVIDPAQPGTDGWFVENFEIAPSDDPGIYAQFFNNVGYSNGPLEFCLTPKPMDTPPAPGECTTVIPTDGGVTVYQGNNLNGFQAEGFVIGPADPTLVLAPILNGLGNINLDLPFIKIVTRNDVPDLAQGPNECAPTSIANSFKWLDDKYSLGLPAPVDTTAEIRDVLKDANHMMTSAATGTTGTNIVKGKLQFIQDHNLKMSVEYMEDLLPASISQGGLTATKTPGIPTFDFICDQLQKGQDVELGVLWKEGGGHFITATGCSDVFGNQKIRFNDPDDGKTQTRSATVGISEEFIGYLELEGKGQNSLAIVVAESPRKKQPNILQREKRGPISWAVRCEAALLIQSLAEL